MKTAATLGKDLSKNQASSSYPLQSVMTLTATHSKMKQHHLPRRKLNRRADIALVVVLVFLSMISMSYCIFTTYKLLSLQNYHAHMDHVMGHHIPHTAISVEMLPLEPRFRSTVKSCLPTLSPHQCPAPVLDLHNVAIVAPPGEFSEWVFAWAQGVIQQAEVGSTTHMHLSIISHVPPFSENHGYSQIIRIVPPSLLMAASDALRGTLSVGHTPQVLRLEDLKVALRLLLRYHCRISQVASHTPVLSLEMAVVAQSPRVASRSLLTFLNITAQDHGEWSQSKIDALEDEVQDGSNDWNGWHDKNRAKDRELLESSQTLQSYTSSLLAWIQKHEHVQVKNELNHVLEEELDASGDFALCHSLWNITEDVSVFSRMLAMSLAPDCAGSQLCTHPRDLCEEKGDAICKGRPPYPSVRVDNPTMRTG